MELYTTFRLCREHHACDEGYRKLSRALGGIRKYGKDTPIPIEKIIETNGVEDAAWAFSAVPEAQWLVRDKLARLFACDCAESVLHLGMVSTSGWERMVGSARLFATGAILRQDMMEPDEPTYSTFGNQYIHASCAVRATLYYYATHTALSAVTYARLADPTQDYTGMLRKRLREAATTEAPGDESKG